MPIEMSYILLHYLFLELMSSQIQSSIPIIILLVYFNYRFSILRPRKKIKRTQHFNIISTRITFKKQGIVCYSRIFVVFFSSKIFSIFVISLYKVVVRFLLVPTCKTLAFLTNLSMLQRWFVFGMQSYRTKRNLLDVKLDLFFKFLQIHDNVYIKDS